MFLSKKTTTTINKSKQPQNPQKGNKALAGWEDEEDSHSYQKPIQKQVDLFNEPNPNHATTISEQGKSSEIRSKIVKQTKQMLLYDWEQLNMKEDIQCEKKIMEEILQPGGIRIKPSDNMLVDLLKNIKGMQVNIIGSLLLSKIQVNYPFQVKAKALYVIEYLVKKDQQYMKYFTHYIGKLSEFPEPQDSVENYRKILQGLYSIIGEPNHKKEQFNHDNLQFVDPGYYDEKNQKIQKDSNPLSFIKNNEKKKNLKNIEAQSRNFIAPNQLPKKLLGPQSVTTNQQKDIFDLNLLETNITTKTNQQPTDLLNLHQPNNKAKKEQITFDQLLKIQPIKNSFNFFQ